MINNDAGTSPARSLVGAGGSRLVRLVQSADQWELLGWVLTAMRFPLLGICLDSVACGNKVAACVTIFLLMITDVLDGEFFRWSRTVTARIRIQRHVLDAICDRIVIHVVLVVGFATDVLPLRACPVRS